MAPPTKRRARASCAAFLCSIVGCGGEPSSRAVENARAFEALLTAVSLKNVKELENDARILDERHASGALSTARHEELRAVVDQARAGDWKNAEAAAYRFRTQYGDRGAYFE
jgi:hypothetical protein